MDSAILGVSQALKLDPTLKMFYFQLFIQSKELDKTKDLKLLLLFKLTLILQYVKYRKNLM